MNLSIERGGIAVETEREDADLARAGADAADSALELGSALGLINRGSCAVCNQTRVIREFLLIQDGEVSAVDLCGGCQQDKIDEKKGEVGAEGECAACGETARLRDIATQTDDGGFHRRSVCEACQDQTVDSVIEQHRAGAGQSEGLEVGDG